MSARWPNGQNDPGDVWHEYGKRDPIWTPNGPTSSFHSGIDIGPWGGKGGTWLLAPVNGEITHAAYDDIFGNRVVVTCYIGATRYDFWLCHGRTGSMQVSAGQAVTQGQRLQLMGETGKAAGEHLHYEVHVNGVRVDPRAFYASPAALAAGDAIATPIQSEEDDMAVLVTGGGQNLIVGGKFIGLNSPEEVQAVKGAQVLEVSPTTHYNIIQAFTREDAAGLPVRVFVSGGDGTVYVLVNGKIQPLADPATLAELEAKGGASITLSKAEVDNLLGS